MVNKLKLLAIAFAATVTVHSVWAAFPSGSRYSGVITPPPSNCLSSTGGTITVVGGRRIHTFTSSGTFTASGTCIVNYLIVAGGGGGGQGSVGGGAGASSGGGAAGQVATGSTTITAGSYPVTIGGGGAGGGAGGGNTGGPSSFNGVTANGGGGGGNGSVGGNGAPGATGGNGGGGGGTSSASHSPGAGGGSTAGQGAGGAGAVTAGGGGGGGGGNGSAASGLAGGNGGTGFGSAISGSSVVYAGGGGGGGFGGGGTSNGGGGNGGSGGGNGVAATSGFGGGGGGGSNSTSVIGSGGNGGSGIVIISYSNLAPPVVNSQTCSGLFPLNTGDVVCTFTASNTPTSWAIVSQTCSGCYQINNSGVVSGGPNAGNVTAGLGATVTVTASNAAGTSTQQTNTISAPSCPVADGSAGSPGGTIQFPTVLSSTYQARNTIHAIGCEVAGVDYAVASVAQITAHCGSLMDWQSLSSGSFGGTITWSGSGHNVNISGTNTVATCFDFTLHNGAQVLINGTGDTISWSNFLYGTNGFGNSDISIIRQQSGSNLTLINDVIDGGCVALGTSCSAQSTLILVDSGVGGTFTLEYCLCQNFNQHILEFNSDQTNPEILYQYNVIYNGGIGAPGAHLNYTQLGNNGNVVNVQANLNFTYEPSNTTSGGEGFQASESSNSTGVVGNGASYSRNTMIYSPSGEGRMHIVGAASPGNTALANQNYIDYMSGVPWSGCGGAVTGNNCADDGSGIVTYTNNINMKTGALIPAQ